MLALFPASGLVKRVVVTGVKRGHAGTASLPRLGALLHPGMTLTSFSETVQPIKLSITPC